MDERSILKTKVEGLYNVGHLGARVVFIGEDINEEKISVTEEEKISYINSINADMYLKIELYSGKENMEIIKSEADWNRNSEYYQGEFHGKYSTYEEYKNNYESDYYNDV